MPVSISNMRVGRAMLRGRTMPEGPWVRALMNKGGTLPSHSPEESKRSIRECIQQAQTVSDVDGLLARAAALSKQGELSGGTWTRIWQAAKCRLQELSPRDTVKEDGHGSVNAET